MTLAERTSLREPLKRQSTEAAALHQQDLLALASFRESQAVRFGQELPLPSATFQDGVRALPGFDGVDFAQCVPPCADMCKAALSGKMATKELRASLRSAWSELHKPVAKEDVAPLGVVQYPRISKCFHAGFCLHSTDGRVLHAFVHQFQMAMRSLLRPETRPREMYSSNALVVCLTESAPGLQHWFHVGYGNLNESSFELLRLTEEVGSLRARVALSRSMVALAADPSAPSCGAANMWQSFRKLTLSLSISLLCYRLVVGDLAVEPFQPKDIFVTVIDDHADDIISLWIGSHCRQVAPRDDDEDMEDDVEHGDDQDIVLGNVVDSEDDVDDDLPPALLVAWRNLQGHDWDAVSEAGSGNSDLGDQPPEDPEGEPPFFEEAPPVAEPPPLPPPPLAALEGPGVAPPGGGPGVGWAGRAHRGFIHPRFNYGSGHIKQRAVDQYIDGHCDRCGAKVDRKSSANVLRRWRAQGRPLVFCCCGWNLSVAVTKRITRPSAKFGQFIRG